MDWVVQLKEAALVQLHEGNRRDRLGHRINAEDRVVSHRSTTLEIHRAQRAEIGGVPISMHRHLAACNLLRLDVVPLEVTGNAFESFARKARALRGQFHTSSAFRFERPI